MASHLGCFVSFPVNRILRNKRHFRPQIDLNCLLGSGHCFVFIVRQILVLPPSGVFSCERQTNFLAGCRMLTVLPFSRNGLSKVRYALHVNCTFMATFSACPCRSLHVCSCCSGVNWKATTEVAFFYLAHKKLNSEALPIVVVIACVAHATPLTLPASNEGVDWSEVLWVTAKVIWMFVVVSIFFVLGIFRTR